MMSPQEMMKKKKEELLHNYNMYAQREGTTVNQINQRIQQPPPPNMQTMVGRMIPSKRKKEKEDD